MECVRELAKEMDLPGSNLMSILVAEGITFTLEKKAEFRVHTGKLFCKLVQEKVLMQQKFLEG